MSGPATNVEVARATMPARLRRVRALMAAIAQSPRSRRSLAAEFGLTPAQIDAARRVSRHRRLRRHLKKLGLDLPLREQPGLAGGGLRAET
jgi:methylphosphotriester-DNA--protein-cysteine methyltransferase